MKKAAILVFLLFISICSFAQGGTWTWMKGSSTINNAGNYGTIGLTNNANQPRARYQSAYWTDLNGDFWLFGGTTAVGNGFEPLNDLWRYSVTTNQWTWISGPQLINDQDGNFGTQGIASVNNYPSARGNGAFAWTDNNGIFWLYGGQGIDALGSNGDLSDLWSYNPNTNEWTWVQGLNTISTAPVYGTQTVPNAANTPGSRKASKSAWVDASNDLWLFGGSSNNSSASFYNDMWRYNIANNEWTWMKGPNQANQAGTYGTQGVEAAGNLPPARWSATRWKGIDNKFYVFGGQTQFSLNVANNLNDVWQYNPITNNWAWISGANTTNDPGTYNQTCDPQSNTFPSARYENHTAQTLGCSETFWSFGGRNNQGRLNDLWLYNLTNNEWTWVSGSATPNSVGNYGTQGVPAASNMIGSKYGVCIWVDIDNNLWIFGGQRGSGDYYNDLWKFEPDTTCFNAPLVASFTLFPPSDSVLCVGDSAKVFVPATATVSWTPAAGVYPNADTSILCFAPLVNTSYTIIGVDTGNCPGMDTLNFNLNVVSGGTALLSPPIDTLLCAGGSAIMPLDTNLSISYSPTANTILAPDGSFIKFSPTTTTTYTVIGNYGPCSIADTTTFTITILPSDPITLNQPVLQNLCVGDSTIMNIDPSYSVIYSPTNGAFPNSDTSQIIFSPLTTTTYTVYAITNGPCPAYDSVRFTINALPITKIQLQEIPDTTICEQSVFFINIPPTVDSIYLSDWSNTSTDGDTSLIFFYPPSTTNYELIVSGGLCTIPDTVNFTINIIPRAQATFTISPDSSFFSNSTFSLTNTSINASSYQWFYNGNLISVQENTSYSPNILGEACFTLIANNIGGCPDTNRICAWVKEDPAFVVAPNAFTPNGDGLNDEFRILADNVIIQEFLIYDRWGKEMFNTKQTFLGWDGKYRGTEMPPGVYYYYVRYIQSGEEKILKGDLSLLR